MTIRYSNSNKDDFSKATNPIKKDEGFFCALGDSFMLKNEYRKAIKEYLVSLMIDKNNIYARKGASKAYKYLKEYDKAIKHLKNARNIYGFDSEIYYELGLNYLLNGNSESAQKNFKTTIKLRPDDKNAQVKLALTHELSGEEDMAILVYNTIIEKNPSYIPAFYSLANLYVEKGEFERAIDLFKEILKINKEYHRAYLGLGLCFDKLGKYIYATRYYKKYISYKPHSQTAKSLVGRIYEIHKMKNGNSKRKTGFRIVAKK
ncbi:MAG: tetratricopeptide repeat protein [Candidatus Gastranaerophilales bacterium]|nr:tetratricopeptide repeat protein [Candidatus Gastranaerophilales bacterium]